MRHLAGAFIRPGRATVRRFRHRQRIHAAIGHGLELFAQRQRFSTGFPGLQYVTAGVRRLQTFYGVKHHVDTGGQHEFVIADGSTVL